ncbi:class I SAM-dependent methyltransferase [Streptomyces albipurpureus]|uniref:Class I SAM-dependent methyltransferase n=1 Tax=Streptomyces albipurpureus TaxID=2897419 RepID=A0ABT0UQ08_9ACTN|nr:class I SAM-dependent methyltransferase [Streptomyces sp. CWNU-1]MCM2390697.1 class I SAM-dependent methyltransferase [Streptomyces sp. CWNU-1]
MEPRTTHAPDLEEIQQPPLFLLGARAMDTAKRRGVLQDLRSVEMVDSMDDDFPRFNGARGLLGASIRTLLFDTWVQDFLNDHPHGTVIELGTGLNSRFERLDNGTVHWFDLDLADARELRHALRHGTHRRRTLAASVTDPSWIEAVRQSPGPYFLVAEAVPIHLDEAEARQVFRMLAQQLPGAQLALETASATMLDGQDGHDVLSRVAARMRWRCDDPAEPERWHPDIALTRTCTFARLPAAVSRRIPQRQRGMLRAMATVMRRQIQGYRFNLYQLGPKGWPAL